MDCWLHALWSLENGIQTQSLRCATRCPKSKNALCPHVMSLTMARSIYFARMHQEYAVKYGEGVCVTLYELRLWEGCCCLRHCPRTKGLAEVSQSKYKGGRMSHIESLIKFEKMDCMVVSFGLRCLCWFSHHSHWGHLGSQCLMHKILTPVHDPPELEPQRCYNSWLRISLPTTQNLLTKHQYIYTIELSYNQLIDVTSMSEQLTKSRTYQNND